MGGFVLVHQPPGTECPAAWAAAAETFARGGSPRPRLIRGADYLLAAYPKRQRREPTLLEFADGDFVCVSGTLLYDGLAGAQAAAAFHRDWDGSPELRDKTIGHYAVILRKRGRTEIVPDGFGGYHVYCGRDAQIASSSFLAIAAGLERMTLGLQSACEYVFNGVVSGDATLIEEIGLAPVNSTIAVGRRGLELRRHPYRLPQTVSALSFAESVRLSLGLLDRSFAAIAANFGDRVACALSGGYDSRLILALLRRHGVAPRVYVYGPAGDRDVAIAQQIAAREQFALEIVDKERRAVFAPDEFGQIVEDNFFACDGYQWSGIFNNGVETAERARRVAGEAIALNGGGGEIWRNFFYLLDRCHSPREILWSFYSQFDPRICTALFDEETYFRGLEQKLAALIGEVCHSLPRPLVEWLYHGFRCRAWDGRVNTINGGYGDVGLPFLEPALSEHASTVPIGWKNHGAYEAELIRRADPRLAAYPSIYGHDFSRPPPFSRRLADYGTYLRPPWLRRYSHRIKHRPPRGGDWPGCLGRAYRAAVLPEGVRALGGLFRLDRVADPAQLNRILSLEYFVNRYDGRVRLDFARRAGRSVERCAA